MNDLPKRTRKALDQDPEVIRLDEEHFLVRSGSTEEYYNVDLGERSCECADHEYRNSICKHQRAAALKDARGEVTQA